MYARWLFILLALAYWVVSLHDLANVPRVNADEPWLVSAAWKLGTEGVLGSEMFRGLYRMESRAYGFMPLQPMVLALMLRLGGLGLFQARLLSVIMGLLTLALTAALGKRLFGAGVGVTAVTLLLLLRTAALTPNHVSGILFLDVARLARYDILVPVLGLAALHLYMSANQKGRWWRYALAGWLAALAALANVYGAFWLGVLLILLLWNRAGWRPFLFLLAGTAVAWLPYALYIWQDVPAWSGQLLIYPERYELLSWRWYLANIAQEPHRYAPGLSGQPWPLLGRPGTLLLWLAVPLCLVALAVRALWRQDWAARVIVTPAAVLPLAFALLLYSKYPNYLVTIVPIWAVALAWGAVLVWQWPYRWLRPLLAMFTLLILLEGAGRSYALWQADQTIQPYRSFISQVRQPIPGGASILGAHTFWLGLDDFEYRSWFVPLTQSRAESWNPPLSLTAALTAVDPTVILIDNHLQEIWAENPEMEQAVSNWMAAKGFVLQGVVEDESYGRVEIWIMDE